MTFTIRSLLLGASLLLALARPAAAQRTLIGAVQDLQGTAIPFAIVELPAQKLGVQADDKGHFSLPLPASLTLTDSLTVSALGYARQRMVVPAGAVAKLQLVALPVSLNEVVVRPGVAKWVGFEGKLKSRGGLGVGKLLSQENNTGWQIARRCQPTSDGYLTAARFFINPDYNCAKTRIKAPFRVRVYAADGPGGGPGTDLLLTSVMAAATTRGWVTVDLSRYGITYPHQGIYVAMEWLYTSDEFLCHYTFLNTISHQKQQGVSYGQSLAADWLPEEIAQTWYYSIEYGWRKMQSRDITGQHKVSDPAIQARFQP